MGLKQAIKKLDAFPRAEEHLLQKTQSGAIGISSLWITIMRSSADSFSVLEKLVLFDIHYVL